jgi:hypothetical protein
MKKFYNILRSVFNENGYNVAPWGEDTYENEDRSIRIELLEQSEVEPLFSVYNISMTVTFIKGDWAENAAKLSDILTTFIPRDDRPDAESKTLPDNSHMVTILEAPQYADITYDIDEDTADEEHSVLVTLFYQY